MNRHSTMPQTEADLEVLATRLRRHADEYAEPDEPGTIVHDLRAAADLIPRLLMNLRHRD